jgi:hypothetical protein
MRRAAVGAILGVAGVVWVAAATAADHRAGCTQGVHPYGGVNARTFCGPAKATVVLGGKTIHYAGGNCERGAAYLSLNIGTVVLGTTTKPKPEYLGLLVGKAPLVGGTPATHDGTYKPQALALDHAGKGYAILTASVKLTGGRTRGSFTGKVFGTNAPIQGTFACS